MSQLLLNMAQQAAADPSLMAGFIDNYSRQSGLSWTAVARELQISSAQLARLALCRQPRRNAPQEIEQIADYVEMNSAVLTAFYGKTPHRAAASYMVSSTKNDNKKAHVPAFFTGKGFLSKRVVWTFGAALVLILLISTFVIAQPAAGSEATLVVSSGEVLITNTGSGILASDKRVTAVPGEAFLVSAGDILTTNAAAAAELRLADGGIVELAENTTVEITHLVTTKDTYQVTLTMLAGRTINRVVKLLGVDDYYQIRTPSSTASVRGTVFLVDVLSQNSTYVAVDEGVVNVSMGDQAVDVRAGFEVTAVLGERLIVSPQNQPAPPPTPLPAKPTPAPTATPLPPTPEPTPTAEPAPAKNKSGLKIGLELIAIPKLEPVVDGDVPVADAIDENEPPKGAIDRNDDETQPEKDNGGNPNEGMVVPGSPPVNPGNNGSPPEGGGTPPGQGGTPPGNPENPNGGGNGGGNSGGNSGNNGGKKDK